MDEPTARDDAFARLRDFTRGGRDAPAAPSADGSSARPGRNSARGAPVADDLHGIRQDGRPEQAQAPHGTCELCSLPVSEVHRHLYEMETAQIVCACDGCALAFDGVIDGRYRTVPRYIREMEGDLVEAIQWQQLSLPINLVFFVRDEDAGEFSAYYPSPGGVTRSALPFDPLFDRKTVLDGLEPYVEALLVNRLTQKTEAFVVPIDLCYELTGLIRVHWRGFSGGEDVRREMSAFFERVRSRARHGRSN